MTINDARNYLAAVMQTDFVDKTFHGYIGVSLAGDFAVEIATVMKKLAAKLAEVEQIVAERERLRAIAEYRRKRIRNTELVALNMTDAFTEQHDRAEKAESALSTALEEMERLARENYNLADRIQSGGIRIQLLTDQLATAEQDRDRLAADRDRLSLELEAQTKECRKVIDIGTACAYRAEKAEATLTAAQQSAQEQFRKGWHEALDGVFQINGPSRAIAQLRKKHAELSKGEGND